MTRLDSLEDRGSAKQTDAGGLRRFDAVLFAVLGVSVASTSSAESWVEYRGTLGPADVVELDINSVKETSAGTLSATWRQQTSFSSNLYNTAVGHVLCSLDALVIDKYTIPDPMSSIPAYRDRQGVVIDYSKGVEIVGKHSEPISEKRLLRYEAPVSGSGREAMVKAVCQGRTDQSSAPNERRPIKNH